MRDDHRTFYREDELWHQFAKHLIERVKAGETIGVEMEYPLETMYGSANFTNSLLMALRHEACEYEEITIRINQGGYTIKLDNVYRLLQG